MKTIVKKLEEIRFANNKAISDIKLELCKLREGDIYYSNKGKYNNWFVKENGEKKYLPKVNADLAKELTLRKYDEYKLNDLLKENELIDVFIKKINKEKKAEKYINSNNEIFQIISEHDEDEELKIISKYKMDVDYRPEGRTVRTRFGYSVRSKTERSILNGLHDNNLKFVYEPKLLLGNKYVHPDALIVHPVLLEIIPWEHFGMIDKESYFFPNMEKVWSYIENGFIPGKNLIITCETKDNPLGEDIIMNMIETYLL